MKDFDSNFVSAQYVKDKEKEEKRKKITGTRKYKKHLKKLAEMGYHKWSLSSHGAYYKNSPWDKTRKPYYKRCYRAKRSSDIKKNCNRLIRRSTMLFQRGEKNKYTEFWWEYN